MSLTETKTYVIHKKISELKDYKMYTKQSLEYRRLPIYKTMKSTVTRRGVYCVTF